MEGEDPGRLTSTAARKRRKTVLNPEEQDNTKKQIERSDFKGCTKGDITTRRWWKQVLLDISRVSTSQICKRPSRTVLSRAPVIFATLLQV
jgi:hypothetical protein